MAAQPNSPNGCFTRRGYTVVRTPTRNGLGNRRVILDPKGNEVLRHAGHDAETEFCRLHGLMLP